MLSVVYVTNLPPPVETTEYVMYEGRAEPLAKVTVYVQTMSVHVVTL